MLQTGLFKRSVDNIHGTFHIAFLIRILNPENKISVLMLCNQIRIKCRPQISHMHPSRRGRCKSCPDFLHVTNLVFLLILYPIHSRIRALLSAADDEDYDSGDDFNERKEDNEQSGVD